VWNWAVVGIGINVNQESFPADLPNPVSLRQITGTVRDPLQLAQGLHEALMRGYEELLQKGFGPVLERYNQWLYKKDQPVRFRQAGTEFTARVIGVTENGLLQLEGAAKKEYAWGEVEWVVEAMGNGQ
jgi:BirA family biotin operon repressor/biotin-[acetyl-CoA-carboxylase] ligase